MSNLIFKKIASSTLLLSAIVAFGLIFIASSTYEAILALALTFISGCLGIIIDKDL